MGGGGGGGGERESGGGGMILCRVSNWLTEYKKLKYGTNVATVWWDMSLLHTSSYVQFT